MFKFKTIFLSLIISLFVAAVAYAWNSPTSSPPNSAGQALYINTSGNVGIGTTAPGSLLHLGNGDGSLGGLSFNNDCHPNWSASGVFGAIDYCTAAGGLRLKSISNIEFHASSSVEAMRIDSNGNVGIGTTAPAWKLDVVGGSMRADGYTGGGQLCIGSDCRASWPNGGSGFTGGGTTNFIPKWTGGTSLGNSTIFDDGTTVTINSYNVRGATYSFGGMYVLNTPDSSCRRVNPFTGACNCPTDFAAGWASDGADFISFFCYK